LADSKSFPIDISTGEGVITLSNPDDKGQAIVPADIEGEANKVRVDGKFLADAFRACNGMVDLSIKNGQSPILFTVDGYQLVTMPMLTNGEKGKTEAKPAEAKAEAKTEKPEAKTEAKAEAKTEKPDKADKKAKEPASIA
jgi:DNA polymerase-3 subunit beta